MSLSLLITLAISVAVCIVIVYLAVAALNLSLPFGQVIPSALGAFIGIIVGQFIHRRFVASR